MIYLDNAATTNPKPPCVIETASFAAENWNVNAGRGSYKLAHQAVQLVEECRQQLMNLVHINQGYNVRFSPSATFSFNEIIFGMEADAYSHIYVSPFEHNAVMRPLAMRCKESHAMWHILPWNRNTWSLETEACERAFLKCKPSYVFISFVSNTTGVITDIANLVKIAHSFGAKVIVDCAQAMGTIEANYQAINADVYVFAGHKTLYGPFGIAGMIRRQSFQLKPFYYGGTGADSLNLEMVEDAEPSSPNITAIAQLLSAVKWLKQTGVASIEAHDKQLGEQLMSLLVDIPRVHIFSPPNSHQRSGIIAFAVNGYQCREVGEILEEEYGICVRTGYQCAPLVHDWLGSKAYGGVIRASMGYFNTLSDIQAIGNALNTL